MAEDTDIVVVDNPAAFIVVDAPNAPIIVEEVVDPTTKETTVEVVVVSEGGDIIVVEDTNYPVTVVEGAFGGTGPAGPQGQPAEEDVPYARRLDFIPGGANEVFYRGEAAPGADVNDPVWRIRRITITSEEDTEEIWADGVSTFTKIWANRLSYSYA